MGKIGLLHCVEKTLVVFEVICIEFMQKIMTERTTYNA